MLAGPLLLRQRISVFEIAQVRRSRSCWPRSAGFGLHRPPARMQLGVFCWCSLPHVTQPLSSASTATTMRSSAIITCIRPGAPPLCWPAASSFCRHALIALFLSVASIVATLVGVRMARLTPEFHGLAYLAAAAFASGLLEYAGERWPEHSPPPRAGWFGWWPCARLPATPLADDSKENVGTSGFFGCCRQSWRSARSPLSWFPVWSGWQRSA